MAWDAHFIVDGLTGESQSEKHKGAITITSFSFGGSNMATIGATRGGGSGTVNLNSFSITKNTDSTSAELFQAMCSGQHFDKAELIMYKSGGKAPLDYLKFEFDECYVDSFNCSGSDGMDTPGESVTFAYGAVKITYQEQNEDGTAGGSHPGSWDIRTADFATCF